MRALDLSPTLLERAKENARVTVVEVDFVAGDAEALPYPDAAFDVVLSQFGHMFAPRQWGDPNVVRERLGARVKDLVFERDTLVAPTLGPSYSRHFMETTLGPLAKLVSALQSDPPRLAQLRAELEGLFVEIIHGNEQRQHFLMSRATKA